MPWEKSFNRSEAFEASLLTFWENGYERTTVSDLTKATGASRYGLYDEFGDKQSLYFSALDYYRDQFVSRLLGSLETKPDAGLSDLKAYFRRLYDVAATDAGARGCFMSLSAIDLAPRDPAVAERVQENFIRVRTCFARALKNAQKQGDWPADRDAKATAAALLGIIQGAAVFQRAGEPSDMIVSYLKKSVGLIL